jgi:hypothetical protein
MLSTESEERNLILALKFIITNDRLIRDTMLLTVEQG